MVANRNRWLYDYSFTRSLATETWLCYFSIFWSSGTRMVITGLLEELMMLLMLGCKYYFIELCVTFVFTLYEKYQWAPYRHS
nr:hypothetical protein LSAT_4X97721 [Ipomoea batatas]